MCLPAHGIGHHHQLLYAFRDPNPNPFTNY
uniref:Uncharacterized protein n=1 Tax=Rhizophora mucronata TaxID=61149 RepID=A0A2P2Q510_RHIMU